MNEAEGAGDGGGGSPLLLLFAGPPLLLLPPLPLAFGSPLARGGRQVVALLAAMVRASAGAGPVTANLEKKMTSRLCVRVLPLFRDTPKVTRTL